MNKEIINLLQNTQLGLVKITKCDYSHKNCVNIVQKGTENFDKITQQYFDEFILMIQQTKNCGCLIQYHNNKSYNIKSFIIKCASKFIIKDWPIIINNFSDDDLIQILKNQILLIPNFIDIIISKEINLGYYTPKANFINYLTVGKLKSFEYILLSLNLEQLLIFANKYPNTTSIYTDNIIIEYFKKNKEIISKIENITIMIQIMNCFIKKTQIITNIYLLISKNFTLIQKKDIFNKIIGNPEKNLILLILENKDIIPDSITIDKLIDNLSGKNQFGDKSCTKIAEIIDLMCEYGLIITKPIIMKLLNNNYYVNNLEKHGITVDQEILGKCAEKSFYPYEFDIIPDTNILLKECRKSDNLITIKKLKELGGIYTSECLEESCKLSRNGKVIKYLLSECDVEVNAKCLEAYEETYRTESLKILIEKYKSANKPKQILQKSVEIDKNSTIVVSLGEIKSFDNSIEYELKNKIRKFFNYKKKTIMYQELHQIVLKYLIDNKLVIGTYFVINDKLSELLKISNCSILHIDQLDNILTYFVTIIDNI